MITRLIQVYVVTVLIVTSQVETRLRQQRQVLVKQLVADGLIKQDRYDALKARARLVLKREYRVDDELLAELKAQRVIAGYPGDTLSTALTGVFGVSLLFYLYLVPFLWMNPGRFLLLRPFGIYQTSSSLKRVARRNLSYSGHVFSLEDEFVRHSPAPSVMNVLLRIFLPLAFIASGRFSLGGIIRITKANHLMVRNDGEYQTLIADINKRYLSNVFWRLSFSRIRSIKAADDWWQRCVNYLIIWCDMIVIDLTVVKAGTLWELEKIRDDGLSYKAVFIVHEDAYEKGRQYVTQYWLPNEAPPVFRYSSRGRLLEETQFLIRVARTRSSRQSL